MQPFNDKISNLNKTLYQIPNVWSTKRILNNIETSNPEEIYTYVYNMKGNDTDTDTDRTNMTDLEKQFLNHFHFLLQTAKLIRDNNECKVEILAEIAYNVGHVLASIDLYKNNLAYQYIISNKLYFVESYVNLVELTGGSKAPVFDFYKKYINMTPYKGSNLFGGSSNNSCGCGSSKCNVCKGPAFVNLLV